MQAFLIWALVSVVFVGFGIRSFFLRTPPGSGRMQILMKSVMYPDITGQWGKCGVCLESCF